MNNETPNNSENQSEEASKQEGSSIYPLVGHPTKLLSLKLSQSEADVLKGILKFYIPIASPHVPETEIAAAEQILEKLNEQ